METTLVINPGSASKKYALYREGVCISVVRYEVTREGFMRTLTVRDTPLPDELVADTIYHESLADLLSLWATHGVLSTSSPITRVGIRVVAPHTYMTAHRQVHSRYRALLETLVSRAPLHIPHILTELDGVGKVLPQVPVVGVSDSAFHTTMPSHASLYSVPPADRDVLELYRYGYHGLSVASVLRTYRERFGDVPERVIVVHVGSGVSMTAVAHGESIDTTMGFSPLSGLIMSSRGGDIDAGALLHIMRMKGFTIDAAEAYLHTCGLKGFVGVPDLRVVLERSARGDREARAGLNAFFYHIHKSLHAYKGILGGLDLVILTGTAAERNPDVRAQIMSTLAREGGVVDAVENEHLYERPGKITMSEARIPAYLMPTDEMGEIARIAAATAVL